MSVDLQLTQRGSLYDIDIDPETGDFLLTDSMDTALVVSLFSDARATADEVQEAGNRRGWIGDVSAEVPERIFGSKLWLLEQSPLTTVTAAEARDYATQSLNWLIEDGASEDVSVDATPSNGNIDLSITITAVDGVTSSLFFNLWRRTVR